MEPTSQTLKASVKILNSFTNRGGESIYDVYIMYVNKCIMYA